MLPGVGSCTPGRNARTQLVAGFCVTVAVKLNCTTEPGASVLVDVQVPPEPEMVQLQPPDGVMVSGPLNVIAP